jgi:hypothetical protein
VLFEIVLDDAEGQPALLTQGRHFGLQADAEALPADGQRSEVQGRGFCSVVLPIRNGTFSFNRLPGNDYVLMRYCASCAGLLELEK